MVGETSGEEGMISNTVVVDQDNCVAVGAALGAVVAILLLILLTIIVLWAWSCKKIKTTKER